MCVASDDGGRGGVRSRGVEWGLLHLMEPPAGCAFSWGVGVAFGRFVRASTMSPRPGGHENHNNR